MLSAKNLIKAEAFIKIITVNEKDTKRRLARPKYKLEFKISQALYTQCGIRFYLFTERSSILNDAFTGHNSQASFSRNMRSSSILDLWYVLKYFTVCVRMESWRSSDVLPQNSSPTAINLGIGQRKYVAVLCTHCHTQVINCVVCYIHCTLLHHMYF